MLEVWLIRSQVFRVSGALEPQLGMVNRCKPDTQAAREGRLIDQIGERATKAEDGEISGADQLLLRSQLNFQDDLLLPIIQRR